MPTGRLTVILGPMFAGKSTELMRRVKREMHARKTCFVIKYSKDTRYSADNMATHDRLTLVANAAVSKLSEIKREAWLAADVIAVDEGQFFPDVIEFCQQAADMGKIVIVSALDGDFRRQPFGRVLELVPLSDEVVKLTAVCMLCHENDAIFTRRIGMSDQTELIGGEESYKAVCRDCYLHPDQPTPRKLARSQMCFAAVEAACGKENAPSAGGLQEQDPNKNQDDEPAAKRRRLEPTTGAATPLAAKIIR